MKIALFDDFKLGVLKDSQTIVDATEVISDLATYDPGDRMIKLIENFNKYKPGLEAASRGAGIPISSVRLRPPLPRPRNIVCMAVNYMENGTRKERPPKNAFLKSPNCIVGDGDTMVLPDVPATAFEGEAELAVVIGRRASNVPAASAMTYVFGYINFIDGSARGLQDGGNTFFQMKSRDTFAPIGPYIVTADEVADPHNLRVRLWVNGELMQDYNTNDMAHDIPTSIEFLSSVHTLEPGDIIGMGTNHLGLNPFQNGDLVELETEQLGRLKISVKDDLQRTWLRETRQARAERGEKGLPPQLSGKYAKANQ